VGYIVTGNERFRELVLTCLHYGMEDMLTVKLEKLVWLMKQAGTHHLEQRFSISFKRFYVLVALSACEPTTQHSLASRLGYSDAAVSRMLQHLTDDNLVDVRQDPSHGRKHVARLTSQGRALTQQCAVFLEQTFTDDLERTGIDASRYLSDTNKIIKLLGEYPEKPGAGRSKE
jgi:DNA-binding MarR family transcriptional regulator